MCQIFDEPMWQSNFHVSKIEARIGEEFSMARPRKPEKILEITGAYKKHPERRRKNVPSPDAGIGNPPPTLEEGPCGVWQELVSVVTSGVLANWDTFLVEQACILIYESRVNKRFPSSDRALLLKCLSDMGLTPASRSKVVAPDREDKKASKWAL